MKPFPKILPNIRDLKKKSINKNTMNLVLLYTPHYKSNTNKIMQFHSNYKYKKLKKTN
jgi:hypothetical protein